MAAYTGLYCIHDTHWKHLSFTTNVFIKQKGPQALGNSLYKVRGKQYPGAMITVLFVPYKNKDIVCYCNQREIIFNYFLIKCFIFFY